MSSITRWRSNSTVGLPTPRGVAADELGNVYVTDSEAGSVHKLKLDDKNSLKYITNLTGGTERDEKFLEPMGVCTSRDGRVFVTGFEEDALVTLCLSGDDGRIIWRRAIPRPRKQSHHDENNPASPTPATDGRAVYAFFADFGLIAYSVDGDELWRRPLGPFSSFQGVANSPVLAGDRPN